MDISGINNSLLFFILIVLGRYLGSNIICGTREVLNNNLILRLIILYLFIVVSLSLKKNKIESITEHLITSMKVFFMALMFTKLDPYSMTLLLSLLATSQLMKNSIEFTDPKKNPFGMSLARRDKMVRLLDMASYLTIFYGFCMSYIRVDKGDDFSHIHYIFGGYGCHNESKDVLNSDG